MAKMLNTEAYVLISHRFDFKISVLSITNLRCMQAPLASFLQVFDCHTDLFI